ncbi:MAG: hypothetical protein RLZZ214_3255 [Verrucomicrobiota bacterium]|jgi:hypothetical protein
MKVFSKIAITIILFFVIILGSGIALVWSVNSYHARHRDEHLGQLRRIQANRPTEEQLEKMFGTPLTIIPTEEAVSFAKKNWGGSTFSISADTSRLSRRTLVFLVSDMVYFVFLDAASTMIDSALVAN